MSFSLAYLKQHPNWLFNSLTADLQLEGQPSVQEVKIWNNVAETLAISSSRIPRHSLSDCLIFFIVAAFDLDVVSAAVTTRMVSSPFIAAVFHTLLIYIARVVLVECRYAISHAEQVIVVAE